MPLAPEPEVTLPWLVRLRWLFLAGQVVALATSRTLALDLHWAFLIAAVIVGTGSNLGLAVWIRRRRASLAGRTTVTGGVLVLDTVLLTVLLAASGGATNPFTALYLVHITLSAVVLSARWTTMVAVLSVAGFAVLFAVPAGGSGHHHHGGAGFDLHLQGMWVAFVLATGLTAFFVSRITRAIASQREQIASLRETSARNARLAALTTLAAGAAHELGNPLATIAVAAHEANLRSTALAGADAVSEDLRLILLEVDRCQDILHHMAARASQPDPDQALSAPELERRVRAQLGAERSARVDLQVGDLDADLGLGLAVPSEQMVQSVTALVRNALDASGPEQRVAVDIRASGGEVRIAVEDRGAGIPGEVLSRVGEPFFTTKQPGRGMGLGVFLARAFFESQGGGLDIESTPRIGTRATVRLPRTAVAP